MPALIPVPKTYEKTADGVHFVPFNFFLSEEKWRENADVFCAAFKKGHANALTDGKKGGIEVYFDASVAENAYRIETTDGPLCLYASAVEGLMYGFATALQLCTMADIASLRNAVEQHHICEANASYRFGDISLTIATGYEIGVGFSVLSIGNALPCYVYLFGKFFLGKIPFRPIFLDLLIQFHI